jgi:FHA domain
MTDEAYLTSGTPGPDQWRWSLPPGRHVLTIGRSPATDIQLAADQLVSREHARLGWNGYRWTIADSLSGNGTSVNGRRLTQEVPLNDRDEIRVGRTVLTFHGPSGLRTVIDPVPSATRPPPPDQPAGPTSGPTSGPTDSSGQRSSGRVNLVSVLVMAGVLQAIGLAGNAAITFVGDRGTGVFRWIAVPVLTVLLAMVTALIQALGQRGSAPAGTRAETSRRQSRGRTPTAVAVLVVLLLVGGAGIGIAAGAQYAVAWATGKENGPDRLAAPVSKGGSIAMTVEHVFHTRHFTRVELIARNNTQTSLTLPLFKNCTLTARNGTTLEADSFKSQWSETLPPGVPQRGTITFDGHLADTPTTATLSFAVVFGRPGGGALTIPGLRIRPL